MGENRKVSLKNTIENDKEKKQKNEKKFRSLRAVEKLVLPNPFLLINNKAPKVIVVGYPCLKFNVFMPFDGCLS